MKSFEYLHAQSNLFAFEPNMRLEHEKNLPDFIRFDNRIVADSCFAVTYLTFLEYALQPLKNPGLFRLLIESNRTSHLITEEIIRSSHQLEKTEPSPSKNPAT